MTQLWCNSNSTCRATYWMYTPSFKLISQSMLKKSPENADGRTDRRTDGHCHGIMKQGKSEGFESCDRPIVRKRPIWVKIGDVLYRVTLKFDGWPWKTIGHLSFAVSSFVKHFIAIGEFKLELQFGNAPIWVKFDVFDVWPWKTIGHLFYATSSSMHHFVAIGEFKLELQSGNAQFGSKSTIFFSRVTLQFEVWPCKTIGHLFYATSSFVHHFVAIGDFKLELQSGNAQFGSNSMIFRAVWPCNLTYDLEKQ